jgi:hypothetical protein
MFYVSKYYEIAPICTDDMSDDELGYRVDFLRTTLHDYYGVFQLQDFINPVKFDMLRKYRETQLIHTLDMIEQRK